MSGSEQFRGILTTLLHNQLFGDSEKLIDGSDVIDSKDGDNGGNLDGDRQMKRLPGPASKTEVVPILGEVISIESGR